MFFRPWVQNILALEAHKDFEDALSYAHSIDDVRGRWDIS
jgi:hypothetical protein